MKSDIRKLTAKHHKLIQSDAMKVVSHVQRNQDDWIINTIMVNGYDVPFKYLRKKPYRDLKGQRVNVTYYPTSEVVAGIEFEVMRVVRIRIS